MESYRIENLSFAYPERNGSALKNINLTIGCGEFITICGKSGCGKTTLLKLLKPVVSPVGTISGNIYFENKFLSELDDKGQVSKIGYVMQSPDNQIVTDKVWHELAFGLESLGYSTPEIRTRVSEMASFFGIQTWFHKKVTELSGGQKQLLNLASVMVMQPSVLLLDEPTSQLDPIAAQEFLKTLEKINRELGTTVILTEHRLEDAFPISDRIIVMENGKIIFDGEPQKAEEILRKSDNEMYDALPAPMRIYGTLTNGSDCPITVCDGRKWLEEYTKMHTPNTDKIPKASGEIKSEATAIELKDVWFRYEKDLPDVIKGLSLKIEKGTFFAIVGGNGTGKTTALSLMSGLNSPYRGKVFINGKSISEIRNPYSGLIGVLPQNPQTLFVKKTVALDLEEILSDKKLTKGDKKEKIRDISRLCRIENLLGSHPYDISGGEQQRAALAKVLLTNPEILLLDEPTKGMDAQFKSEFADIIKSLNSRGVTVVAVSHDIEFCAEFADRCAMFFDGSITSSGTPREFFAGKSFYTTSANRMARTVLSQAVLADDIVLSFGGEVREKRRKNYDFEVTEKAEMPKKDKRIDPLRLTLGCVFALFFVLTEIFKKGISGKIGVVPFMFATIFECAVSLMFLLPQKHIDIKSVRRPKSERRFTKRTAAALFFILIAIPFTMYIGIHTLHDKKYYFISLMIILETLVPFCALFESRKPQPKEIVTVSVLCAIAVAGRTAFYMLPQFKPVAAVVIISGICFGGEAGFLVGAVTAFVSDFFFGQGPWTPWQMFSFGLIGFIAGTLFDAGLMKKEKVSLCVFGFVSVFVLYGVIMNSATVVMSQTNINFKMIVSSCILGIPFDLIHAVSTVFFLWFAAEPMIEKIERVKIKYGLLDR